MVDDKNINLDAGISIDSNEQVDLALTMYTLLDQGLLKTLIKEHKYDVSLRRLPMEKLPKGVKKEEVVNHFKNKHLYTIDSFYYNLIYDFTELGIIDNTETKVEKAVKPIENLIIEINNLIDDDVNKHNNEVQIWKKLRSDVSYEYEEAQCSKKLRLKKITSIINDVNNEINYINKKLLKYSYKAASKLANSVYKFFKNNFNIDLYNQSNPLNEGITDLAICFSKSIDKEVFEFLVYYLELFVKYYSSILEYAKSSKKKNAYEIFDLDYNKIKNDFYNEFIPSKEKIVPNPDGFITNAAYHKYFSIDFGKILAILETNAGVVIRTYITKEILRRKKIDKFVQVAPNVFSYGVFALILLCIFTCQYTLLKNMDARLTLLVTYILLLVSLAFCLINLYRNTKQFKRPKRAKYQRRSLVVLLLFYLIGGSLEAYYVNRFDGYDYQLYYCFNGENTVTVEKVRDKRISDFQIPSTVDSDVCPGIIGTYTVNEITKNAFKKSDFLTSIVIPDSVETIGNGAFSKCGELVEVTLPSSLTAINKKVFMDCHKLETLSGDCKISYVEDKAFANCYELSNFNYFDNINKIGKKAFSNCRSIEYVKLTANIGLVDDYAFEGCSSLNTVDIYKGPGNLGKKIFSDCTAIKNIMMNTDSYHFDEYFSRDVKENVESVELISSNNVPDNFFKGATNLTNVIFNSEINSIGVSAFEGCSSLSYVEIPETVTSIGNSAFKDCTSLNNVVIPSQISVINESLFENCTSLRSIILPNTTTIIKSKAFKKCNNLNLSSLPNDIKTIESEAFSDCLNLNVSTLPSSLKVLGDYAFRACEKSEFNNFENLESIGIGAFQNCLGITQIILSDELSQLGKNAFNECDNVVFISIDYKNIKDVTPIKDVFQTNKVSEMAIMNLEEMPNYFFESSSALKTVNFIGCELKEIKKGVFKNCNSLETIDLSSSNYTIIAEEAFSGCSNLTDVILGSSITEIKNNAFSECHSLSNIVFPASLKVIGENAFASCYTLNNVIIPNNIEKIGKNAFVNCSSLTNISIDYSNMKEIDVLAEILSTEFLIEITISNLRSLPKKYMNDADRVESITFVDCTFTSIPEKAFANCISLKTIDLSNTDVETIGPSAFYGCSDMINVVFGSDTKVIEKEAFFRCVSLNQLSLPNGIEKIGKKAFYGLEQLATLSLPSSLQEVEDNAFDGCKNIQIVNTGIIGKKFSSMFGSAINNIKTVNLLYDDKVPNGYFEGNSSLITVNLSDTYTTISKDAFKNCYELKEINISNIISLGSNAFRSCRMLENVTFNSNLEEISDNAFNNCLSLNNVIFPKNLKIIGKNAFNDCESITRIEIPTTVEKIGTHAFANCDNLNFAQYKILDKKGLFSSYQTFENIFGLSCGELSSIVIVDSEEIPNSYFSSVSSIHEIELKNGIKKIGKNAFNNCYNLNFISLSETDVTVIPDKCFYKCNNLQGIYLNSEIEKISKEAFKYCNALSTIDLSNTSLKTIEKEAFNQCSSLSEFIAPSTLENISGKVFNGCRELSTVDLSLSKLISIPDSCFENCYNLINIYFPNTLKTIGKKAFSSCNSLTLVSLSNTVVTEIKESAFENCTSLISLGVPNSLKSLGDKTFKGCTVLTYFDLSSTDLTTIPESCFENCSSLGNILYDGLVEIEKKAFLGCGNVDTLRIPSSVKKIGKESLGYEKINVLEIDLNNEEVWNKKIANYFAKRGQKIDNVNIISGTKIYNNMFRDFACSYYEICDSVSEIGKYAFAYSGICSIDYPVSLEKIGYAAFMGCFNLDRVDVDSLAHYMDIEFVSKRSNPLSLAHNLYIANSQVETLSLSGYDVIKKHQFAGLDCAVVSIFGVDKIESGAFSDATIYSIGFLGNEEEFKKICKDFTLRHGKIEYYSFGN